jgi:hypothetical protein
MFRTMKDAIEAANASEGSHRWFSPATMEAWGTIIESDLVGGHWFVTSEYSPHTFDRSPEAPRVYSVRYIDDDGEVGTAPGTSVGNYATLDRAMIAMGECTRGERG